MEVFISWSGARSGAAAEALRAWLPKVINAVKPWLSSADIDKGARWSVDIATRLEAAKAGIICLTPSNLHSDWILFEAGALSKTIKNTFVCPLLIDLEPSEVKGPLAQFQLTRVVKGDVLKLLKTLNVGLGDEALTEGHIDEVFEVWWPKLDSQLKALPSEDGNALPPRNDRDLLVEILGFVRNQSRPAASILSEEDRKTILTSRAWKVLRSLHGMTGGSTNGPISRGADLEIQMTIPIRGEQRKYTFIVPAEATPDEMEARMLAEARDRDQRGGSTTGQPTVTEAPATWGQQPPPKKA
ncbi:MAG: toll/interleukin-1 receptor domain-containing protein [Candidatus Sulfotelmatobacter sp.]